MLASSPNSKLPGPGRIQAGFHGVNRWINVAVGVVLGLTSAVLPADEIRVAVASNFRPAMKILAKRFEARSGHQVQLIFGSTGKQYAQIINGAPFDAFFAADIERPLKLEQEGLAISGSRYTYALGKLVLWSPKAHFVDSQGKVLETDSFQHLALANPALAPYGMAAQEVLEALGLWTKLEVKLVRGENTGQTYQFISSGNAELGFIALAQIKHPKKPVKGSYWDIPQELYAPIEQQAVLLIDTPAGREFLEFTRSWDALKIISNFGYSIP
jgi:molybdate transport system substrate-binding protein